MEDLEPESFHFQQGRKPFPQGLVQVVYGFEFAAQMELLPSDGRIDVRRKVGVEDLWTVAVSENLFDLILGRVGCHFGLSYGAFWGLVY